MIKFTWLFLINEIWISIYFQKKFQPKKIQFWLFNTVYHDTVNRDIFWDDYHTVKISYRYNQWCSRGHTQVYAVCLLFSSGCLRITTSKDQYLGIPSVYPLVFVMITYNIYIVIRETGQFSSKGIINDFIGNLNRLTVSRRFTEQAV